MNTKAFYDNDRLVIALNPKSDFLELCAKTAKGIDEKSIPPPVPERFFKRWGGVNILSVL